MGTYRHTDIQTYRHTDIQTYRHTDIPTTDLLICIHRIHSLGSEANESFRRLNTFYLEETKWSNGLRRENFVRSKRSCPGIESAKYSFHTIHMQASTKEYSAMTNRNPN